MKTKTLFQMSKQDLIDYAMTCFYYEMMDNEESEAQARKTFEKMDRFHIIKAIQE